MGIDTASLLSRRSPSEYERRTARDRTAPSSSHLKQTFSSQTPPSHTPPQKQTSRQQNTTHLSDKQKQPKQRNTRIWQPKKKPSSSLLRSPPMDFLATRRSRSWRHLLQRRLFNWERPKACLRETLNSTSHAQT